MKISENTAGFNFEDQIRFTKAVFYNFRTIPLPKPFRDATGGMGMNVPEQGYLELYDDTGACAHYTVSRNFVSSMLPKILNGEKKSFRAWKHEQYWKIRNAGFQSADAVNVGTLELMMLDILAQRAEKPIHRFLGAEKDWAAAYKGGGAIIREDEELVEEMCRYAEEGTATVKFKVGSSHGELGEIMDMERDLRRIEKVKAALAGRSRIAVDCNQKFTVEQAVEFCRLAEPYDLEWVEEPIHSADYNGIKRMKEMGVKQKLSAGESMRVYYAYEPYVEKGIDILQPSLGRMSRIDDLLKIRDLCRENGLEFQSGGRGAYNAYFGALYGDNERIEFHAPISEPVHELMLNVPTFKDSRFTLRSDIPGMPVRMDLKKIEKLGYLESVAYYQA